METKNKNYYRILKMTFTLCYVFMVFAIDALNFYNIAMLIAVALPAVAVVFTDLRKNKTCLTTYRIDVLLLFILINLISVAVNFRYGFKENIFFLFTPFVDYLIFYNFYDNGTKEEAQNFFKTVMLFALTFFTGSSLFSFMTFALELSSRTIRNDRLMRRGFIENRLFGMYGDPNYMAITSLIFLFVCVYFIVCEKKTYKKVGYGIVAFIHYCYYLLSGSRTGVIALMAAAAVGTYFAVLQKMGKKPMASFKSQAVCILLALCATVACFGITEVTGIGFSYLPSAVQTAIGKEKKINPVSLERSDVEDNSDYSNNRIKIWKSAGKVFLTTPVVGTSPRNLTAYAKEKYPFEYISRTGYMVHNGFIELFVLSGLAGGICLLLFLSLCAVKTFRLLFKNDCENFREILLCTMCVIVLLVSSLTLSGLFYNRGMYNMLFWFFLGYLMFYVATPKESVALKTVKKIFKSEKK